MVDEVATKGAVLFARRREDGDEPAWFFTMWAMFSLAASLESAI